MMQQRYVFSILSLLATSACGSALDSSPTDDTHRSSIQANSQEARAILAVVNDPAVTFLVLDGVIGLDRRAARNITVYRNGPDGVPSTSDDQEYTSFQTLDDTRYVGERALQLILTYAYANGYANPSAPNQRARLVLEVVNNTDISMLLFDDVIGLDRRAAASIIEFRFGPDGVLGSSDDRRFVSLAQLDEQPWVGVSALERIHEFALRTRAMPVEAVFSPQPYPMSHNVRVAGLVDAAVSTIDVAIYSFSDDGIYEALARAVRRGIRVRVIFETANADRRVDESALATTRSARLERMGINVRWVNKIMHHKFMIVDGPHSDLATAAGATIVTGSGNWSYSAATRYDENTLFFTNQPELALRFQREMNLLWDHSRDFVFDGTLPYETSSSNITDADIPDDPNVDVYFTSGNFTVSGDTFRIQRGLNTVGDALVAAIGEATSSIWVASGHLRSRPIAEALIAKRRSDPNVDIRVYLDGQEMISAGYHQTQQTRLEDCVTAAQGSAARQADCYDRGFYFGYELGLEGIAVRYKHYAFRWHYSYAIQMHHKVLIIDGDELWTGSYNLSDNAEHNTFENMIVFRGAEHSALVDSYENNFVELWGTSRDDGTYAALLRQVENEAVIPLVYTPMALDHAEVTTLKAAIRANCTAIDSAAFREAPERHRSCQR